MHRSVCDLEMVGWLVSVARYAGLAEWLPTWNRNGDVHRDTEPYLHWNALCESHWVSRSMNQFQHPADTRIRLIQETGPRSIDLSFDRHRWLSIVFDLVSMLYPLSLVLPRFIIVMSVSFLLRGCKISRHGKRTESSIQPLIPYNNGVVARVWLFLIHASSASDAANTWRSDRFCRLTRKSRGPDLSLFLWTFCVVCCAFMPQRDSKLET